MAGLPAWFDDDENGNAEDDEAQTQLFAAYVASQVQHVVNRTRAGNAMDAPCVVTLLSAVRTRLWQCVSNSGWAAVMEQLERFVTTPACARHGSCHDLACDVLWQLYWERGPGRWDTAPASISCRLGSQVSVACEALRLRFGTVGVAVAAGRAGAAVRALYTGAAARFMLWSPHTVGSVVAALQALLTVECLAQWHTAARCPPALQFLLDDQLLAGWNPASRAVVARALGTHMLSTRVPLWPCEWARCSARSALRAMVAAECVCGKCGTTEEAAGSGCVVRWVTRTRRTAWLAAATRLLPRRRNSADAATVALVTYFL